ncbi:precorrin-6Y C5,15-methyltransferase (decarboxylating) subunit CbiT [Geosporobacter ferrireducens]|uniref:Precorrin-6Y C5,15-methyltransferase (Decarboxylating) subunit CbiT n=1 Tax=Geosporobacter ferrireducens TaxID=1424294 RepID=A0A1D8GN57_9FIRM|nr:precorrin-6Y C5,15-methyltransferase (decarboxylating) subunit CbiT [Geosporobacter ferrireducens]AOT72386.1 precorrin-6Y C5,15-methyltransferase (decarboxylating) subunit CbiT [Geosporobacter ferrireducens]MTI56358.1 precorrin-6Y C5,15-methyltransferase (decarboxylating) subunit CbiT [Geosporobacter ferrireducens]
MEKIQWNYKTPGIPDRLFVRGKVPMTKEEVRAVTISKLRLQEDSVVLDIGAGTGSIAIEAAHICRQGKVIAIERNIEGIQLIQQNCHRFQVELDIRHGNGAELLETIDSFDRVVVGGSGGELKEILTLCHQKLRDEGIVVVNAVTIETLYEATQFMRECGYQDVEVISLQTARGKQLRKYTLMEALNPIYIISGSKGQGLVQEEER